jgi:hypothetical protein
MASRGIQGSQTFVLPPTDRERIANNLRAFVLSALPGKKLRVEVGEFRKRRSDEQNRYLWGVCYATLRDATGNDCDDLHTYFLGEHFGWQTVNVMGQKRRVPMRRSSKLTTVEFAEFVAFIQQRAAENGVYIPNPDMYEGQG